jgi:hypothetical protein
VGMKRQGREADNSPPSSAEVKECAELCLHSTNTPSCRGDQLKHGVNFTFTTTFKIHTSSRLPSFLLCIRSSRVQISTRRLVTLTFMTLCSPSGQTS